MMSRRQTFAGFTMGLAGGRAAAAFPESGGKGGPWFSPLGPDADHYGAAEGFPVRRPIEDTDNRVGAFSHFDTLFPTRRIEQSATAWNFRRSAMTFQYRHNGALLTLADYVNRNSVTGLLIAKGDDILFEDYHYGRTDRDRLASQSIGESIIGLLIGIAIAEGAIRSVDDTADAYVPEFKGTEYGKTPIRDLLHMSSGVAFGEEADNGRDLNRLWLDLMGGYVSKYAGVAKGTIDGIVQFNRRIASPGTRFFYASIEADVLGLVLRRAVGRSISDYLEEKIWQPMGSEADASWLVDAQGFEVAHGFFNAVLRDYARLGRLLANDGALGSRQIIPEQWLIDATTIRASDFYLAPGKPDPTFGYGYLLWLLPWGRRQFALFGAYGQRICVDPVSRLVLVQTAVEQGGEIWSLRPALVKQLSKT
jgi:CubicO group peptidase (beta-lactamase class C family)